jgi:hypothetical protein
MGRAAHAQIKLGNGGEASMITECPTAKRTAGAVTAAILGMIPPYLNAPGRFTPRANFSHQLGRTSVFGLAEQLNVALGRQP